MSTTSPILLLSRSTMTRPRQPRAVSMLGVAMLASFLVGYLSRLLGAVALHVTDASSQSSFPPRQIPVPGRPAARAWTCRTAVVAADGSKLCPGQIIGGLGYHGTSLRWRSLAGGRG